jgi:NAD(P)-dependent dehydrogenase (short-subunit alcohol dehydrogenase family)
MPVALVTGSARGVGRAIALRLAQDGFDIGVNDLHAQASELHSLKTEIEGLGRVATIVLADVTQENEVSTMVNTVVEELGGLNVVRSTRTILIYDVNHTDLHAQMVANAGAITNSTILESA